MNKILLGFIFGIFITLVIIFAYKKMFVSSVHETYLKYNSNLQKRQNKDEQIAELKILIANSEEKFNSVNKRFDDLYVLGSVIITLMLAMVFAIYVNTANEVETHIRDNFKNHSDKILKMVDEAEVTLGKSKAQLLLLSKMRENANAGSKINNE